MHQPLFPPRRHPGSQFMMSEVVKKAIREHWVASSSSDELSEPDTPAREKKTQNPRPRKPPFKALQRTPSHEQLFSQIAQQTSLNQVAAASLERDTDDHISKNRKTKTTTPSTLQAGLDRPVTPQPKAGGSSHTLPLRAVSTSTSYVPGNHNYEPDNDARKMAVDQVSAASSGKFARHPSHEIEETLSESTSGVESRAKLSQSLYQGSAIKPQSGLKLRTPTSANLPSMPTLSSKKRSRASIYDLEDDNEEIEKPVNSYKRQQPKWQTAAKAFEKFRKDGKGTGSQGEPESILVPRTPPPTEGQRSVYLPRL